MKEHSRVVEEMPFQTRATAPFSTVYDAGRIHRRSPLHRDRSNFSRPSIDARALRKNNAPPFYTGGWERRDVSRFPNQEMRNIKYSRESALHNFLSMPTNFSRVFVTRPSARGTKFNLARRVKRG